VQIEIAVSGQGDGQKAVQAPSRAVSASEEPPREQSDQRPGLPAGSPQVAPSITFGFCGRLVTAKGLHILLEAAHQLKLSRLSFRLLVVGDGVERPRLEAQTREYQLDQEVRFLGTLTGAPLDAALQATDAILMPSVGGEVFGLVALENMMRGKLVVVSDSRALTEVVGDAGLSCPEGDVAAWAACMERLIKNPALCREFSRRSRERAREFFSAQKMVAGHLAVYRTVLENSR
jgi:glycosyltransferase involved in cell wall biosynthesis